MRILLLSLALSLFVIPLGAQNSLDNFFSNANTFFQSHVQNGLVDYAAVKQNIIELNSLRDQIGTANINQADATTKKAFYINAYNLLVIGQIVDNYPVSSPLKVSGFFDNQPFDVAGEKITLNQLEKNKLLATYKDARFHFVLVCGALGCPPIIDVAYLPATVDAQLEQQTRLALNDANFIKVTADQVALSQIFEWYADDFGGTKAAAISFINGYRDTPLSTDQVGFYPYDWNLNMVQTSRSINTEEQSDFGNNSLRYVVSASIPEGSIELKAFTNLYTQETGAVGGNLSDRATFFTQNLSALYGFNNRFNAGIDIKYRQVSFGSNTDSGFDVFTLEQTATTRQGLTGIGPKIRYSPFIALPNFSIQSTYWIATGTDLGGNNERPFIDFNGDVWFTQIFNDFSIGDNFSVFTEIDILVEDIGAETDGHINRFSTPVQTIFSFFPNSKTTIYALGSYSPYWQEDYDYFYQAGMGTKYQINPRLEVELLYTQFRNSFIRETDGTASTLNFGLRVSIF